MKKSLPHEFATDKKEIKLANGETFFTATLGGMEIGFNIDELKRYKPSKDEK